MRGSQRTKLDQYSTHTCTRLLTTDNSQHSTCTRLAALRSAPRAPGGLAARRLDGSDPLVDPRRIPRSLGTRRLRRSSVPRHPSPCARRRVGPSPRRFDALPLRLSPLVGPSTRRRLSAAKSTRRTRRRTVDVVVGRHPTPTVARRRSSPAPVAGRRSSPVAGTRRRSSVPTTTLSRCDRSTTVDWSLDHLRLTPLDAWSPSVHTPSVQLTSFACAVSARRPAAVRRPSPSNPLPRRTSPRQVPAPAPRRRPVRRHRLHASTGVPVAHYTEPYTQTPQQRTNTDTDKRPHRSHTLTHANKQTVTRTQASNASSRLRPSACSTSAASALRRFGDAWAGQARRAVPPSPPRPSSSHPPITRRLRLNVAPC